MKKMHIFVLLRGTGGVAIVAGFSAVVMLLWNCLMPVIFNLTLISFWQALGLLALSRILFGGIAGKHWLGRGRHHNPMREKWMKMTPEERKEFIRHRRFGHGFCRNEDSEKKD
jgi:hypothetical protein